MRSETRIRAITVDQPWRQRLSARRDIRRVSSMATVRKWEGRLIVTGDTTNIPPFHNHGMTLALTQDQALALARELRDAADGLGFVVEFAPIDEAVGESDGS